jgi:hypothetical protein
VAEHQSAGEIQTLRIEDEDGFATEWEWPEGRSLLGHGDFIGLFEAQHDAAREAWLSGSSGGEG